MAIGCTTSGSPANRVTRKPSGTDMRRADSLSEKGAGGSSAPAPRQGEASCEATAARARARARGRTTNGNIEVIFKRTQRVWGANYLEGVQRARKSLAGQ